MDVPSLTASQIRDRMRGIRRDLHADVKGIVTNASQMFDWKSYVRSFPWSSLMVAGIVGYLLVPRRPRVIAPAPETVEAIVREQQKQAAEQQAPPQKPPTLGFWSTLIPALGAVALRMGINLAVKTGMEMLGEALNPMPTSPQTTGKPAGDKRSSTTTGFAPVSPGTRKS